MDRFTLIPSDKKEGYWVATDTVNMIVCVFKEHHFNEDQHFTLLDETTEKQPHEVAGWVNEMCAWLRDNHYEIIF